MGIYEDVTFYAEKDGKPVGPPCRNPPIYSTSFVQVVSEPGIKRTRVFHVTTTEEVRTNCFCCSCGDREGDDAACRNHGSHGLRPCEEHGMPGAGWDDLFDADGTPDPLNRVMPDSVQQERQRGLEPTA